MFRVLCEYSLYLYRNNSISNFNKIKLIVKQIKRQLQFYLKRKKLNLEPSKSYNLVQNISDLNCGYTCLKSITNRMNSIKKPNIFRANKNKCGTLNGKSPDINIYFLENCRIFSKTSSIMFDGNIYNKYLDNLEPQYDFKNGLEQYINSYKNKKIILYKKNKKIELNDNRIYINLLHEHSGNYFHWLYEVMPKFILICQVINENINFNNKKFKILIDDLLPKQFIEILTLYSTIEYDYEIVESNTSIRVKNQIYCTDLWSSMDNTMFTLDIKKEFFVDKYAVELIKNNLKVSEKTTKPFRKIYLERSKNQARFIQNNEIIKEYLINQGFECIKPENFSFKEQIEMFNESKIVIGTSGAVFSNLTFMQKNTCAIIFSPNTVASNYYIFQQMADVSGVELMHMLTNNALGDSVHKSSTVNFKELKELLDNLGEIIL